MLVAEIFTSPVDPDAPVASPYGANWYSTNPYGNWYYLGPGNTNPAYHTGDDLIYWPGGPAHKPIYAIANGTVIYRDRVKNADGSWSSWGKLIVIEHVRPDGSRVYSRYAHEEDWLVELGDQVLRGQMIAHVGNAEGRFAYHLHFDISLTDALKRSPWDWPGLDMARIQRDYVNPTRFLQENGIMTEQDKLKAVRDSLNGALEILNGLISAPAPTPAPAPAPAPDGVMMYVKAADGLNVRQGPGTSFPIAGKALFNTPLVVNPNTTAANGYNWMQVLQGPFANLYVAKEFLDTKKA